MLDRHVLLLNQNYEPLSVCKARRALVLVLSRKAEMLEPSGTAARTVRMAYRLPSVLRLNYFVRVKRREVPLTKRNVLRRDGGVCQYCGRRGALMTTDHVVPRASNGGDSWERFSSVRDTRWNRPRSPMIIATRACADQSACDPIIGTVES